MILAAGGGRRFDDSGRDPKVLRPFRGRPMFAWAVQAAIDSGIGPTWVVSGAADLSGMLMEGVRLIRNERWGEGQATSLQAAVAAAREEALDAIVVGLADQPLIPASAWRAVAASDAPIAVATYDGMRRNPVKLAAGVWDLLPTDGDEGARSVFRYRPDLVEEVPCEGEPVDIDTREDLHKWS